MRGQGQDLPRSGDEVVLAADLAFEHWSAIVERSRQLLPLSAGCGGCQRTNRYRLRTQAETGRGKVGRKSAVAVDQARMSRWQDRAPHDRPVSSSAMPTGFADQRLGDEDALAFPRDLARNCARAGPGDRHHYQGSDAIRHLPLRWRVDLVRRSLAECFITAALRCSAGGRCRSRSCCSARVRRPANKSLGLEGAMHALVADHSPAGRPGWMKCGSMPSLIHHADNRVEAAGARSNKRRAIVATDGARQSLAAKRRRKDRLRSFDRQRHDPHLDQVATHGYRSVSAGRSGCCRRRGTSQRNQPPARSVACRSRRRRPPPSSCRPQRRFAGVINPARWRISPIVEAAGPAGLEGSLTHQDRHARSQM